ncbi:hypothetical protein ABI59_08540 [Acidobacteria bacterium Mor1]|nr:hypothetical protein ABI59_08540 [Acidobacteria bacterium Mor1]
MPPIYQSSLFVQESFERLAQGLAAEHANFVYTRGRNPTVAELERKLARLEQGDAGIAFASGIGAIAAIFFALLSRGDHILFVNQNYGPTVKLAGSLERFGIEHDVVLDLGTDAVASALRPDTRLIWFESPGSMLNRVLDVPALAALARERGILTAIDNSWATPLLQKPLTQGIDISMHTCTKYIGGHSDVVGGVLVTREDLYERIFHEGFMQLGSTLSPHDAWLLIRGLRTLPARLEQHERGGREVAAFLAGHSRVAEVYYPDVDEPGSLAARQLRGGNGMVSLRLDGAPERLGQEVRRVIDRLRYFHTAVSWGGVESLAVAPAAKTSGGPANADAMGIPPGLIRLSVGLEPPELLIEDLDRALRGD